MQVLVGSLYLISTAVFCVVCLVIGVRLVALSRRTGGRPELLLGLGLGLQGGVGYGVLIAVLLVRQAQGGAQSLEFAWISALAKATHDVGVVCALGFLLSVFRPGETWAHMLAGVLVAALWVGFAGYAAQGGYMHMRPDGVFYWMEFGVISASPIWGATEALSYWSRMRRRRGLGLGDPLVENRFLLWGLGSLFSLAAIWTISWPALRGIRPEEMHQVSPGLMLATALWGMAAIAAYWLTFFPTRAYRAWVTGRATT